MAGLHWCFFMALGRPDSGLRVPVWFSCRLLSLSRVWSLSCPSCLCLGEAGVRGQPCYSLEAVLLSPPCIFSSSCSSLGGGGHAQAGSIRGRELDALGRHFGRPHRPLAGLHAMGVGPAVALSTTCPGCAVGVEGWPCRPMSALSRF